MPEDVPRPASGGVEPTEFRCVECGYDVSGTALGGCCPECGHPIADSVIKIDRSDQSCGIAVAVMVLGIVSVAGCTPLGLVAIGLYPKAKREIERGGYSRSALTMARAGFITGIIATAVLVLYVGLMVFGWWSW